MKVKEKEIEIKDVKGIMLMIAEGLDFEEAIKVGTIHGAYASYEEGIKGSLEKGKLADLVVLDKDPRKVDPMEIIDIPIQRTMVGGKWMYES